jgi:hypothetical protein
MPIRLTQVAIMGIMRHIAEACGDRRRNLYHLHAVRKGIRYNSTTPKY